MPEWWNGIHVTLKMLWAQAHVGSSPTSGKICLILSPNFFILKVFLKFASLAQLVEQLPLKEMVGGSNPSRGIRVASQLLGLLEDLKRFSILLGNGKSAPCKGESITRHNLLYFLPEVGLDFLMENPAE